METTRILLVEDDPDITHYVVAILKLSKKVEHVVTTCSTLAAGAETYARGEFDVVLLDPGLPDAANPLQAVRTVVGWDPEPCVIVLTSQGTTELGLDAVRHGAHDFLLKSTITPPMLERVVSYARERHERRTRLLSRHTELSSQVSNLEAYVASVSHDLRSPLASASMLLQFLRDRHTDLQPEQLEEFLARADSSISRGLQFADDLLEDVRVGGEARSPLDLEQITRDAISMAGISDDISTKRGPFPTGIWGRQAAMLQVLANLLANAARFADPVNPRIHVWAEDLGKNAQLYVEDNGPGVPAEQRTDVFQPGVTHDPKRTGLGLSTVQRQIALDGGRVWVEDSTTLGGAKFVVNIPLRSRRVDPTPT